MGRFDLSDFEWDILAAAHWRALGGYPVVLWPAYDLREPFQPLA